MIPNQIHSFSEINKETLRFTAKHGFAIGHFITLGAENSFKSMEKSLKAFQCQCGGIGIIHSGEERTLKSLFNDRGEALCQDCGGYEMQIKFNPPCVPETSKGMPQFDAILDKARGNYATLCFFLWHSLQLERELIGSIRETCSHMHDLLFKNDLEYRLSKNNFVDVSLG